MCEIDFAGETCSVFNEEKRRARKPHTCCGCNSTIEIGTVHVYVFMVFDREPYSERECPACTEDREVFEAAHKVSFSPGGFGGYLDNCIDEGEPGVEKWIAMREAIAARAKLAEGRA